jgi:hypothetical protein
MAFVKYSTVPLEVIGDDDKSPEWVKKAEEEEEEKAKRLRASMKDAFGLGEDSTNGD